MHKSLRFGAIVSTFVLGTAVATTGAIAGPDNNKLVVDGKEFMTKVKGADGGPLDEVYSGWRFRKSQTQSIQADDFENPGFPFVDIGEAKWNEVNGTAGKSCASCHNDVSSFKGLRAQMPKWDAETKKPITMQQLINRSLTKHMGAKAWKWESSEMLGMVAYIGLQSRGMAMNVKTDGKMAPWAEKGKEIYYKKVGQLDMSCANCHEANYGKMIRADHLSQGQINGFPTYRFKWQKMGSIHRRFKGCMKNIRAKPYKVGGDEFVALELYVASRGNGLSVETPAVRN